jgi:glycosyltransferase involved in cell wall biosynthesis
VTAIVPAYNEAASIAETVISLQRQSYPVTEIIVVDDYSTDATGEIARSLGATVLRPPKNTGSKAGAQTFALPYVQTDFCMAIDADTALAADAVERIMKPLLDDEAVAAACGFVVPRRVGSVWERGRYIEYLFAFTFYKPIQDFLGKPLISSGCFSAYRTELLRAAGGWSARTMAEDMDLTWTLYGRGPCCGEAKGSALGWAAMGGVEAWIDSKLGGSELLLNIAASKGALDYLNATDYPADFALANDGHLDLTSGGAAVGSIAHYWTPRLRTVLSLSAARTDLRTDRFRLRADGRIAQGAVEYVVRPALILGFELGYYHDRLRDARVTETASAAGHTSAVIYVRKRIRKRFGR